MQGVKSKADGGLKTRVGALRDEKGDGGGGYGDNSDSNDGGSYDKDDCTGDGGKGW